MLDIIIMIVAVAIILLSLLQGGKYGGISAAFGGNGGLNLFANAKERGPEKVISNITLGLGVSLFVLVVLVRVLY